MKPKGSVTVHLDTYCADSGLDSPEWLSVLIVPLLSCNIHTVYLL